ncbi:MAG: 4-hydroxy-3-methylbut-2-enyl diphosphate reductase [Zetaproteobacteria bacterium]|nr:4-hydroxy-3-methylbut-2-enyl diphosphate reductase [Zetaproteobacteria bacterium]
MKLWLAQPRGFCAGVDRAIEIVEQALAICGAPVFVRHEIVHNKHVVEDLRQKGAQFINEVDDAPDGATLVFSAHGVSQQVREHAQARNLHILDATCPLVTKVHLELLRHYKNGHQVILIGHAGHPEVEGTMGQAPKGAVLLISTTADVDTLEVNDAEHLAYVTQTTLSIDDTQAVIEALKTRFPNIQGPKREDICYATTNRQNAVKALSEVCDLIFILGSKNSSNSQRLCEMAKRKGIAAQLIDRAEDIDKTLLPGKKNIGITAGASAPEILVQALIVHLRGLGYAAPQPIAVAEENITFHLPVIKQQPCETSSI